MTARAVDKDHKAKQIIRHATAVFAAHGYNATTIDAIAARAKIGKGTVYQYFNSKRDLFLAVFDNYMQGYLEQLHSQVSDPELSPEQQLRKATRAVFTLGEEVEELFPLVFEFWSASASPETRGQIAGMFRRMYSVFREFFGDMIRRGIERGEFDPAVDIESITAVVVGSFDGLFLQAWFDENMNAMKAGTAFIDVLIRGLKAPGVGLGTE